MSSSGALRSGAELAYADYTSGAYAVSQATPTDIPGLSLPIPNGAGPYWVMFWCLSQYTSTASWTAGNTSNARVQLVDEGGVVLGTANAREQATAVSQSFYKTLTIWKRMPAPTQNKTVKAQAWLDNTTMFSFTLWSGTGGTMTAGASGPMCIAAIAR